MRDIRDLPDGAFHDLMALLASDTEDAERRLVTIRAGLVRFFMVRGCGDPDDLADETIWRVASKVQHFDPQRSVDPIKFIYGFALNLCRESRRRAARSVPIDEVAEDQLTVHWSDPRVDERMQCLNSCMNGLSAAERELLINYYVSDRGERVRARQRIADELGCSQTALHTRLSRLRASLRTCIEKCTAST